MAKTFTFELVSPEKLLFSGDVDMAVIPAEEGDIGVLADHAPLIATVRPGVIRTYSNGQMAQRLFVAGGFLEVTKDRCTMLADAAVPVGDIDRAAAHADLARLSGETVNTDKHEKTLQQRKLAVAKAMVDAAGGSVMGMPERV